MPRQKREWYPGATYHVMSRGNRRLVLYKDSDDYLTFLESICKTREKYPFKMHSLCLMSNHFHMIVETADVELWKIMQRMLHPYSINFNRKYKFTGHLFETLVPDTVRASRDAVRRPGIRVTQLMLEADTV